MDFYENAHRLRDGAILLYTRPGRKKVAYQARLKIPGVVGYVSGARYTTCVIFTAYSLCLVVC